jgi:hypothetical protein
LENLVSGAKPCTPNLLCHTINLVSKKSIDINSQILYIDPNTDLDVGPHTDPNLGIQDIIMSHFANLICFGTFTTPPPPRTLNQKSMVESVTKIIF